jgi:uncharacterized protein YkwD
MRKLVFPLFLICLITLALFYPGRAFAKSLMSAQNATQSIPLPFLLEDSGLITAVNAARAANGLYPLESNSILNQVAQKQADYELAIRTMTDISADGLQPFQRALLAGYPVAGNVTTNVGWFSELLYAGTNLSVTYVVNWWETDPGHRPYLLSTVYRDIGAGIATSGNTSYFVLDLSLSTGGTAVPITPPASYGTATAPFVPPTPNADGSITYIVQPGDTWSLIGYEFGIPEDQIEALNNADAKTIIYVNEKLIIRAANTATPTQLTATTTSYPSSTPWPTSTPTPTTTPFPPTSTLSPGLAASSAGGAVLSIVVAALLVAGLISFLGARKKT